MRKQLLSIIFFIVFYSAYAQVGIGTTDPKTTLHVVGNPSDASSLDGITVPRMTGDQLIAKSYIPDQLGTLIYVTVPSTNPGGQASNVIQEGLYIFSSSQNQWMELKSGSSTGVDGEGWNLSGNNLNGKTNDGKIFLGTTTYNDLFIRVNNTQIGRFSPQGGVGLGFKSVATANNSLALGYDAVAKQDAVAIGYGATNSNNESIAIGKNASSAFQNVAIGLNAKSSANNAIALGTGTTATSQNSIAIGNNAGTQQNESIAIGADSDAKAYRSSAIGFNAQANNQNSTAIGLNTSTTVDNTIVLGDNSGTYPVNVGIGTNNPTAKLQVNGTLRYVDTTPGDDNGKILTSDADGNASWQNVSTTEAYGEMYADNLGGVDAAGTFTRSLNASTVLKNVTHNTTEYYLQVGVAGNYEISYSVSIYSRDYVDQEFEFFVERAPNNKTYSKINQSSSEASYEDYGQKINLGKRFYVSLNANDRLRLRYTVSTNFSDSDFPSNTCNLSVKRLGSN